MNAAAAKPITDPGQLRGLSSITFKFCTGHQRSKYTAYFHSFYTIVTDKGKSASITFKQELDFLYELF